MMLVSKLMKGFSQQAAWGSALAPSALHHAKEEVMLLSASLPLLLLFLLLWLLLLVDTQTTIVVFRYPKVLFMKLHAAG